jgi:hypothetical protein
LRCASRIATARGHGSGDSHLLPNDHFERQLADGNVIARLENDLPLNPLAVDERPVGAAQVAQSNREVVDGKHTVVATDKVTIRPQVAVLLATNEKLPDVERNRLPLLSAFKDLQFHVMHGSKTPTENRLRGKRADRLLAQSVKNQQAPATRPIASGRVKL